MFHLQLCPRLPAVHAYSAILRLLAARVAVDLTSRLLMGEVTHDCALQGCYSITPVSIQICAIILKILSACAVVRNAAARRRARQLCEAISPL